MLSAPSLLSSLLPVSASLPLSPLSPYPLSCHLSQWPLTAAPRSRALSSPLAHGGTRRAQADASEQALGSSPRARMLARSLARGLCLVLTGPGAPRALGQARGIGVCRFPRGRTPKRRRRRRRRERERLAETRSAPSQARPPPAPRARAGSGGEAAVCRELLRNQGSLSRRLGRATKAL